MKKLIVLAALGLVVALAPSAKAGQIDFSCSGTTNCNGTVSGGSTGPWATGAGGITVTSGQFDPVPSETADTFTLNFDTSAGTASVSDASDGDVLLTGSIVSASCGTACNVAGTTTVTLVINWTGTAEGVHITGAGTSTIEFKISNGKVGSVDANIQVVPEPSSLLLMGSGLLALGGVLRRRILG